MVHTTPCPMYACRRWQDRPMSVWLAPLRAPWGRATVPCRWAGGVKRIEELGRSGVLHRRSWRIMCLSLQRALGGHAGNCHICNPAWQLKTICGAHAFPHCNTHCPSAKQRGTFLCCSSFTTGLAHRGPFHAACMQQGRGHSSQWAWAGQYSLSHSPAT